MFVGVNLFITDAGEISIEMILVTDLPWISPMADTQNVYVYRSRGEGGEWKRGTVVWERAREQEREWKREEGGRERDYAVWGDNKRGKIR